MRVLIVAPNISMRMGGEAALGFHYVRELRRLGCEVFALSHARVRDELRSSTIWRDGAVHFVEDAPVERRLHALGAALPPAIADTAINSAIATVTMTRLARRARTLAREVCADIIHQPTPVSPRSPSFLTNMPCPVVIGPLNGDMEYPPAFKREFARGSSLVVTALRAASKAANRLFPGKREAARVLVANERTRAALPAGIDDGRVEILTENGVDLDLWTPPKVSPPDIPTFVFVGRLVWWKAVELLIEAFCALSKPARLVVIGDGPERARLENIAGRECPPTHSIEFRGFLKQADIAKTLAGSTALVLPSLRECGGAVILEAFACRIPAIATAWGGPTDYVTPETGVLVPPTGRDKFIGGLARAMQNLADEPGKTRDMGAEARALIESQYAWSAKAKTILDIYARAQASGSLKPAPR